MSVPVRLQASSRKMQVSAKTALSRRVPFARQVADNLRDLIIRGELPPGSRIVERTLSEHLSVSRTPLREALKLLESEGLVELSQNKGARIMSFTPEEATSLFEVIAGLESMAAEITAMRITATDLEALEGLHARMLVHFGHQERDPYFALNSAIHERIVQLSGNPVLIATHAALMLRARRGRYMAIIDPHRWDESVNEHEALMRALRERDCEAARKVWRTHLLRTGESVASALLLAAPDATAPVP